MEVILTCALLESLIFEAFIKRLRSSTKALQERLDMWLGSWDTFRHPHSAQQQSKDLDMGTATLSWDTLT